MSESLNHLIESIINLHLLCGKKTYMKHRLPVGLSVEATGAVPANQPVSGGEATDRFKSFRRKMADCPS